MAVETTQKPITPGIAESDEIRIYVSASMTLTDRNTKAKLVDANGKYIKKELSVRDNLDKIMKARIKFAGKTINIIGTRGNYEMFNKVTERFRAAGIYLEQTNSLESFTSGYNRDRISENIVMCAVLPASYPINYEELCFGTH